MFFVFLLLHGDFHNVFGIGLRPRHVEPRVPVRSANLNNDDPGQYPDGYASEMCGYCIMENGSEMLVGEAISNSSCIRSLMRQYTWKRYECTS